MDLSIDYFRVLNGMKRLMWKLEQHFCEHPETYDAFDWSYSHRRCSVCHKTLEDLRKK